jgi:hypothetical protein
MKLFLNSKTKKGFFDFEKFFIKTESLKAFIKEKNDVDKHKERIRKCQEQEAGPQ